MATIEEIEDLRMINVTASVGKNGVNSKNDVMVVQAMLSYGLEHDRYFRGKRFPLVTGTMDSETRSIIRAFQTQLRMKNGVRVSIDGRIDPAKGLKAFGRKGRWTIQMLNAAMIERWILTSMPNGHYISDMCKLYPAAGAVLGDPVGTLALSLEPSGTGLGSLGLGLE